VIYYVDVYGRIATVDLTAERITDVFEISIDAIADIDLRAAGHIVEAELPTSAIKSIADAEWGLCVMLPQGTATFDENALAAIVETAAPDTISVIVEDAKPQLNARQQQTVGDHPVCDISVMKLVHGVEKRMYARPRVKWSQQLILLSRLQY
jgi:hypothetical protein